MAKDDKDGLSADIADTLENELSNEFGKSASQSPDGSARHAEANDRMPSRLPKSIAGGFLGLRDDLDKRSREWRNVSRAIEQQRPLLETYETERGILLDTLGDVAAEAIAEGKALALLLESTKSGDVSGNLAERFSLNLDILDRLAGVSTALTDNLLSVRSTWEEYVNLVAQGQEMRQRHAKD